MNGNTLMNIGPTSRGCVCDREMEILGDYAHWMKFNSRSIYHCGAAPKDLPPPPADCRYTYNKELNRLYIHLMRWSTGTLVLHGLAGGSNMPSCFAMGAACRSSRPIRPPRRTPTREFPRRRGPAPDGCAREHAHPGDRGVSEVRIILRSVNDPQELQDLSLLSRKTRAVLKHVLSKDIAAGAAGT